MANSAGELWASGLFQCFAGGTGLCLGTCFCPCFTAGEVASGSNATYCIDCVFTFTPAFWLCYCLTRGRIRAKYNIPGNVIGDCCAVALCPCCGSSCITLLQALIQEKHMLDKKQQQAAILGAGK